MVTLPSIPCLYVSSRAGGSVQSMGTDVTDVEIQLPK